VTRIWRRLARRLLKYFEFTYECLCAYILHFSSFMEMF